MARYPLEEAREGKARELAELQAAADALVGATILSARATDHGMARYGTDPGFDDCVNRLVLETTAGTFAITGTYGGYTGWSCDEYVQYIEIQRLPEQEASSDT